MCCILGDEARELRPPNRVRVATSTEEDEDQGASGRVTVPSLDGVLLLGLVGFVSDDFEDVLPDLTIPVICCEAAGLVPSLR